MVGSSQRATIGRDITHAAAAVPAIHASEVMTSTTTPTTSGAISIAVTRVAQAAAPPTMAWTVVRRIARAG